MVAKQISTGGLYAFYYWYRLMSSVGLTYLAILPVCLMVFFSIAIHENVLDPVEYLIYSLLSFGVVMASFPFLTFMYLKRINKLREAELSYFKVWYLSFLWLLSFAYVDEMVEKLGGGDVVNK